MNEQFEEIRAVVAFFEKIEPAINGFDPKIFLLMGMKNRGYGANHIMPVGGHYEEIDEKDPVKASRREGFEESELTGGNSMVVAQLIVTISEKKQKLLIDVVIFTSWSGKIKNLSPKDEFKWLKFLEFSQIPWDELFLGEKEWMQKVFIDHQPSLVKIECGTDRNDVKSITFLPLPAPN